MARPPLIEFEGPKPTPKPVGRTLEPAPTTGGPMDDDEKPPLTPPGAVRRFMTETGAVARATHGAVGQMLGNNTVIALFFWLGHVIAYAHLLATLLGWRPGPVQYVYVERCEDVATKADLLRQR